MDNRPIGVFDSGVGGLSAVRRLEKLLPGEDIVYFGDTGRMPYGTRSRETIIGYSKEIDHEQLCQADQAVLTWVGKIPYFRPNAGCLGPSSGLFSRSCHKIPLHSYNDIEQNSNL